MTARAVKWALVGLAFLGIASCDWGRDSSAPSLIGYWYPVEINGEPTVGSSIELHLKGVNPDTLKVTGYQLSIGCRDSGRWDQKRGVLISDERMTDQAPQGQCDVHDPKRLNALRHMTQEGVSIRLDRELFSATLSTGSGQTARFNFLDMTPVD
jgi:hypothetical protein